MSLSKCGVRASGMIAAAVLLVAPAFAITPNQVDDFEDGTTQDWTEGGASGSPPTNVTTGGPSGAGDNYLRNESEGGGGSGSRQVSLNQSQWAGNYIAAGIIQVEMDLANFGATSLSIRIAFQGAGAHYGSNVAAVLPADGQWRHVVFGIGAADLSQIDGLASLDTVLAGVSEMRILHAPSGPIWGGGPALVSVVGIDNITAVAPEVAGSGRVPNGADLPGVPLLLDIVAGQIHMSWSRSCDDGDTDFEVYVGTIGAPLSALPLACSTGGATSFVTDITRTDEFFLVVPAAEDTEGSYGVDSNKTPRPPSAAACLPQSVSCE